MFLEDNALSAFGKASQTLHPASEGEIESYRSWIKEMRPIASAESRFLEYNKDLVSLSATPPPRTRGIPHDAVFHSPVAIASAAVLLPLMSFSMVSEFAGRLFVVIVIGGAIAANCLGDLEEFIRSADGWRYVAL